MVLALEEEVGEGEAREPRRTREMRLVSLAERGRWGSYIKFNRFDIRISTKLWEETPELTALSNR
nr:MAG: hypothetical protein EDM05_30040 [Leptolyngbya sp. IPPAS B-1204]